MFCEKVIKILIPSIENLNQKQQYNFGSIQLLQMPQCILWYSLKLQLPMFV